MLTVVRQTGMIRSWLIEGNFMAIISESKLDFWIKHNYNVLFIGKHGVGKTHSIIDAFNRNKLNWLYFSASTLDPFVDLIGVPKEVVDEDGNRYLDLIRPKALQNDEVEAIIFDEYNRSKPKVRNAVMELIQFKSINGKKFNNLKVVWAAINPDDDDSNGIQYDVEALDPAQKDRFHVIVDIPYKVDRDYIVSKYGELVGIGALEWWNGLTSELKELCSPRRLDYALDMYNNGGDMYDVLDKRLNVAKLINQIKAGSYKATLQTILKNKDGEAADDFFSNVNNQDGALNYIKGKRDYVNFFIPYYPRETVSKLLDDPTWRKMLLSDELRTTMEWNVKNKLNYLYTKSSLQSNTAEASYATELNSYLGANAITPPPFAGYIAEITSPSTTTRLRGVNNIRDKLKQISARTTDKISDADTVLIIHTVCDFIARSQSHTISGCKHTLAEIIEYVRKICSTSINVDGVIEDYNNSAKVWKILSNQYSGDDDLNDGCQYVTRI